MRKHTYEYVKEVIENKGGTLLSKEYVNNSSKLLVRCAADHEWPIAFSKIASNRWCPRCATIKTMADQTFSYAFVKKYIESRSGTLLSDCYVNSKSPLKVKCEKGHIWTARLANIRNLGRWCHFCGGTKKLSLADAKEVGKERGGQCLSTEYINSVFSKLLWRCKEDHEWYATLNNVKIHNKWCPQCSSGKSQKQLFDTLKKLFGVEKYKFFYNFRGFSWLNGQEVDIFIKSKDDKFSLAVECDGIQHYFPVEFFGGQEKFLYTQKLDEMKNKKILENKQDVKFFLRVPYWEKINQNNILYMLGRIGAME